MKMEYQEIRELEELKKVNRKKVNRIVNDIETAARGIRKDVEKNRIDARSLKMISKELKSLSCKRFGKFTDDVDYVSGKNALRKLTDRHLRKESMEGILKIIDRKDCNQEFITEEIMRRNSIKNALKARKREFGFKSSNSPKPIHSPDLYIPILDEKKSKMLKKILYNHKYLSSIKSKQNPSINSPTSHPKFNRNSEKLKPISLSPSILRQTSPTSLNLDLMKTYQEAVKISDIELGIDKSKLSRLLSLKGVFNFISK